MAEDEMIDRDIYLRPRHLRAWSKGNDTDNVPPEVRLQPIGYKELQRQIEILRETFLFVSEQCAENVKRIERLEKLEKEVWDEGREVLDRGGKEDW